VPLRRAAWIIGSAGERIACILANLSHGGAQLELLGPDRHSRKLVFVEGPEGMTATLAQWY
jgi:hypothetical protein